jgi:hypothetical protein
LAVRFSDDCQGADRWHAIFVFPTMPASPSLR